MLANAVAAVLPQLGFGRLELARANEVLEGHGRDLDVSDHRVNSLKINELIS